MADSSGDFIFFINFFTTLQDEAIVRDSPQKGDAEQMATERKNEQ